MSSVVFKAKSRITKIGDSNYVLIPAVIREQLGKKTIPEFTIMDTGLIQVTFVEQPTDDATCSNQ